jgi:hypothetical protein
VRIADGPFATLKGVFDVVEGEGGRRCCSRGGKAMWMGLDSTVRGWPQ